jgi:hypothetical protein
LHDFIHIFFLENAADSDAIIAAFGSDELAFAGNDNYSKEKLQNSRNILNFN